MQSFVFCTRIGGPKALKQHLLNSHLLALTKYILEMFNYTMKQITHHEMAGREMNF
jgi:hypothetical protein